MAKKNRNEVVVQATEPTLYQSIQAFVTVDDLVNDSLLHLGGYEAFSEIAERHRLSSTAQQELISTLSWWQGQYDNAPTQSEKDIIWLRMSLNLMIGCRGAEANTITETEFHTIIGYTPTAARFQLTP